MGIRVSFIIDKKFFELSNHLGNVLATVNDTKIGVVPDSDGTVDNYIAKVVSASDYSPFGMEMVNRSFSSPSYRYGFNGKEKDDEAKGSGNQYDYGMRIYDPRTGRFLSVDPLTRSYPMLTPYQFASNTPIQAIDIDGLEGGAYIKFWLSKQATTQVKTSSKQTPQQNTQVQQSTSTGSLLKSVWKGAKSEYNNVKSSLSKESIRNTLNDAVGTVKDFGGAMGGNAEAANSFANRATNFTSHLSDPVSQPATFIGTMHTRSANENAEGIGKYGLQLFTFYVTDRIFRELNSSSVVSGGRTLSEKFSGGGTKLVSSEMLARYPTSATYGLPAETFIAPKAEIDALLSQRLSRIEIASKLGITDPAFLKGTLIRIDVTAPMLKQLNLRTPTGKEAGANNLFIPGGKTSAGLTEGVVNGIPKTNPGVAATELSNH